MFTVQFIYYLSNIQLYVDDKFAKFSDLTFGINVNQKGQYEENCKTRSEEMFHIRYIKHISSSITYSCSNKYSFDCMFIQQRRIKFQCFNLFSFLICQPNKISPNAGPPSQLKSAFELKIHFTMNFYRPRVTKLPKLLSRNISSWVDIRRNKITARTGKLAQLIDRIDRVME